MIRNKDDLKYYLDADEYVLNRAREKPRIYDQIWKFQILLRKVEYFSNIEATIVNRGFLRIYQIRKHWLGIKLGFDIPVNVFGAGLRINHFGNIVVNGSAQIGMWCDIHQGVNIGSNNSKNGSPLVPKIGSNVWIGPGAKIFGEIVVGDEVQIGANSVVSKSVESNTTVVGIPAKKISDKGTDGVDVAASKSRMLKFIEIYPQYKLRFKNI